MAIGRGSSEILCLVKKIKKTSRLKQKAFGTNVLGGLNRLYKCNTRALLGPYNVYTNTIKIHKFHQSATEGVGVDMLYDVRNKNVSVYV